MIAVAIAYAAGSALIVALVVRTYGIAWAPITYSARKLYRATYYNVENVEIEINGLVLHAKKHVDRVRLFHEPTQPRNRAEARAMAKKARSKR